jgi:hypothetical protein
LQVVCACFAERVAFVGIGDAVVPGIEDLGNVVKHFKELVVAELRRPAVAQEVDAELAAITEVHLR